MEKKLNKAVVIVAGGSGKRMGLETPKQFIVVAGKPILMHTIFRFYNYDPNIFIVLVLPFDHIETWNRLCSDYRFTLAHQVVPGGAERYFSVKSGLEKITNDCLIAIHDGVRPLVSEQVIANTYQAAATHGSAIPVISPSESIRKRDGDISIPVNREQFILVQTPQIFKAELLKKAYEIPYQDRFTDDATVFEANGQTVHLVEGNVENIKITRPADILFAEGVLKK